MPTKLSILAAATALAVSGAFAGQAAAEVTLRAVSAFPTRMSLTGDFMRFIKMVNAAGTGEVQIKYIGGPEITPPREQGSAMAKGLFDVLFGPPSYYAGIFPESVVFSLNLLRADKIRSGGGAAILDRVFAERVNAKFLAFAGGDVGLYIFLRNAPKMNPNGTLNLKGLKLRSAFVYRGLFRHLGATPVVLPFKDIHTSLQRGLVDGLGWNLMGVTDFGWNKHLRYRIAPAMYKSSLTITMNLDKWKALSPKAKKILSDVSVAYENALTKYYEQRQGQEAAKMAKLGMKVIMLKGAGRKDYEDAAFGILWKQFQKDKRLNLDLKKVAKVFYGR